MLELAGEITQDSESTDVVKIYVMWKSPANAGFTLETIFLWLSKKSPKGDFDGFGFRFGHAWQ